MQTNQPKQRQILLSGLVVTLIAAVTVQGYFLYRMHQQVATLKPTSTPAIAGATPPAPGLPEKTLLGQAQPQRVAPQISPTQDPFADDWNPFVELQRMQAEMEQLFASSRQRFHTGLPAFSDPATLGADAAMNLTDDGDHYTVTMEVPGKDKSDLNVNVEDRTLTVSGTVQNENEDQSGGFTRVEHQRVSFQRALTLPGPVDSAGMQARLDDGILTVQVPKPKSSRKALDLQFM